MLKKLTLSFILVSAFNTYPTTLINDSIINEARQSIKHAYAALHELKTHLDQSVTESGIQKLGRSIKESTIKAYAHAIDVFEAKLDEYKVVATKAKEQGKEHANVLLEKTVAQLNAAWDQLDLALSKVTDEIEATADKTEDAFNVFLEQATRKTKYAYKIVISKLKKIYRSSRTAYMTFAESMQA